MRCSLSLPFLALNQTPVSLPRSVLCVFPVLVFGGRSSFCVLCVFALEV